MPRLLSNSRISVLIAAILVPALAACSSSLPHGSRAKPAARGRLLFEMHCSGCHSGRKLDLQRVPPDLHGVFERKYLPSGAPATDALVRSTILTGRSGIMPSFAGTLSEEEIRDIIAYLHIFKAQPQISPQASSAND